MLNSQPFNGPSQHSMQTFGQNPSLQNPNYLWPQNLSSNIGPPGLSTNLQGSMQEPLRFPSKLSKLPPSHSFTHIPLRHNHSPYNTPPLSKNSTFTDLPNPNAMNSGPLNIGMLPPRHATFSELPKTTLPKPNLTHFGSVSHLPTPKPSGHGPSSFSTLGGMNPMGGLNQIGGMNQLPMNQGGQGQMKKPLLNPRVISQPELPLSSEINKYKLNSMSSQNIQDLIEGDILLKILMNRFQDSESADSSHQSSAHMDLNEIKK